MSDRTSRTPPLTNRGCFTPDIPDHNTETGIYFHLDYLKLSIFGDIDELFDQVRDQLIVRSGLDFKDWENHGSARFWDGIYEGPGPVHVLVPKHFEDPYATVEIKGRGCDEFGPELLSGFLRYVVDSAPRWNGLRVDLAFDHVPFTPHTVDEAIRRGDIKSRCLGQDDREWRDNEEGQTAYLGGPKFAGPRRLRVYNMRGFTRFEAEFKKEWASTAIYELTERPLEEWPTVAAGLVRGMVEFVDSTANPRLDRCPLLGWWDDFVGHASVIKNISDAVRRRNADDANASELAKAMRRIDRAARSLWPLIDAWGGECVVDRLVKLGEAKIEAKDRLLRDFLERIGPPTDRVAQQRNMSDELPF